MFGKKNDLVPDEQYFTIFDTKVGVYRKPILNTNAQAMMRDIQVFYRNPQNSSDTLFTNSEDFQLFKIADYYTKTGEIIGHQPEHIANLHELKTMVQRDLSNFKTV